MAKKRLNLNGLMTDIKRHLSWRPSPSFSRVLAVIPFCMMGYFFYERDQKIARQLEEIEECIVKAKKMKFLQTDRNRFVNRYSKANHFYVEEILEPLPLLSGESKIVQAMSKEGFFGGSDLIKKRENALVHNRMKFAENKRAEGRGLVETESHLLSKVEVDGDDLKHILSLIEGVYIGPFIPREDVPQLIIKRFCLEKKKGVAMLDLEIIKRELHEKH